MDFRKIIVGIKVVVFSLFQESKISFLELGRIRKEER
jgi:hypothetical protein